jgi:hypothetical protein
MRAAAWPRTRQIQQRWGAAPQHCIRCMIVKLVLDHSSTSLGCHEVVADHQLFLDHWLL